MTRNVELLEQVMQHIEDYPEQHNQDFWVDECGTAACFAGWACLLSGWQVAPKRFSFTDTPMVSPNKLVEASAPVVAMDLLGLSEDEARELFYARNTRPILRLMVKDLVNGEPLLAHSQYLLEAGDE